MTKRHWATHEADRREQTTLDAYLAVKCISLGRFFRAKWGRMWRRELAFLSGTSHVPSYLRENKPPLPTNFRRLRALESLAIDLGYRPDLVEVAPAVERNPRKLFSANELCREQLDLAKFGQPAYWSNVRLDLISKHSSSGRRALSDVLLLEAVVLVYPEPGMTRSWGCTGQISTTLPTAQRAILTDPEVVRQPVTPVGELVTHQDFKVCHVCAKPILEQAGLEAGPVPAARGEGGDISPEISLSDARGTLEVYREAALATHPTDLELAKRTVAQLTAHRRTQDEYFRISQVSKSVKALLRAVTSDADISENRKDLFLARIRNFCAGLQIQFDKEVDEHRIPKQTITEIAELLCAEPEK